MHDDLLQIREFHGEGYQPLIDFGSWRVAILRWEPGSQPEAINVFERHTETDEVFILLQGWATLLIGGNQGNVDEVRSVIMEREKLYNVKQYTWHSALLSQNAVILIVENCDTGKGNSEFFQLTPQQREVILALDYHR